MLAAFIGGLIVGGGVGFLLTVWFSKNNKNTLAKVRDAQSKIVDKIDPRS